MRRHLVLLPVAFLLAGGSAADAQERRVVKDPGGLPSWTAQLRETSAGTCAVVRRGRLPRGLYCSRLSDRRVFSYVTRRETHTRAERWRTVFVITFARSILRASLTTPEGTVRYRRGRGPRVLLAVLAGDVEQARLAVTVRSGSRAKTIVAGPPVTPTVDDPLGGAAWRLAPDTDAADAERACVAWQRVRPRFSVPAGDRTSGARRCGDADAAIPVAAAERVDGRLVVTGVAGPGMRSVVLRANDGTRALRRDRRSGEFLAVLPGDVDPAGLTVVATTKDDETTTREVTTVGSAARVAAARPRSAPRRGRPPGSAARAARRS